MSNLDDLAKKFYEARKQRENHKLNKFYRLSDKQQFVGLLATGFFQNHFYMKASELLDMSKDLHLSLCKKDPQFHILALKAFRRIGYIKDQIVVGLAAQQTVQKFEPEELELLKTFPPKLILRWINFLRTKYIGKGYASRQKRLVTTYFADLPEHLLEYYAMRYQRDIRDIVRLTHPKLEGAHHNIIGWAVAHKESRKAPTSRIEMFEKFISSEVPIEKKLEIILDYDLPFEIIRSNLRKEELQKIDKNTLYNVFQKVMSPSSVVFNLRYLLDLLDPRSVNNILYEKVEKPKSYVSSFDIVRAAMAVDVAPVKHVLYLLAEQRVQETITHLLLPKLKTPRVAFVIDVSGSMFWDRGYVVKNRQISYAQYTLPLAAIMRPLAKKFIFFSDYPETVEPFSLYQVDGLIKSLKEEAGGTNIAKALKYALSEEVDTIFLFTDEQENALYEAKQAQDIISRLEKRLFVINPSPYPAHAMDPSHPLIHYIPATTPETLIASLRFSQMADINEEETKEFVLQLIKQKQKPA